MIKSFFRLFKPPVVEVVRTQLGPADGFEEGTGYYFGDKLHREDGPAFEGDNGTTVWRLKDHDYLSFEEWLEKTPIDDELKVLLKIQYG